MGETFYLTVSDTAPILEATLEDGSGSPIDLSGADVQFVMREPRGGELVIDNTASIEDGPSGVVTYEWAAGDTDTPGRYRARFVATYGDGSVESFPNVGYHDIIISE